jgi:hypothetical protein
MAITIVQQASASGFSTGSAITATLPSPTTAGNCLVVCASGGSGAIISGITLGGASGNFALAKRGNTNNDAEIWTDQNCAGGQTAVAVTPSTFSVLTFVVYEVAGLLTTGAVDVTVSGTGAAVPWSSGTSATTSQPNELWVGCCGINVTSETGPASPWVNTAVNNSTSSGNWVVAGVQIVSATGTVTYNGTGTGGGGTWDCVAISLIGASQGPPAAQDQPQINPGPAWLDYYKPWYPFRQRVQVPPSGPNPANLPNPSDIPQIQPGPSWRRHFKPQRAAILAPPSPVSVLLPMAAVTIATPQPATGAGPVALPVATVAVTAFPVSTGEVFGLPLATVAVAAPAPAVPVTGLLLSTATITVTAPAPGITVVVPLVQATIAIATPQPAAGAGPVALSTAAVSIGVPIPVVQIPNLSDILQINPGRTWWRRFKGQRPLVPPHTLETALPLTPARVTVTAVPAGIIKGTLPLLTPAAVTITAYPVLPSRNLVVSISSTGGTDDYGNSFPAGLFVGGGEDFPRFQLGDTSGDSQILMFPGINGSGSFMQLTVPSADLAQVPEIGALTEGGVAMLLIQGPGNSGFDDTNDWVQLEMFASDGFSASMQFVYTTVGDEAIVAAELNSQGWTFSMDLTVDATLNATTFQISGRTITPQPTPAVTDAAIIAALQAAGIFF